MRKNIVLPVIVSACAMFAPIVTPGVAQTAAPTAAPAAKSPKSAQIAALKAQIDALRVQRSEDGANRADIDARISKLEQQIAQIDPNAIKRPPTSGNAAADSTPTGPEIGGGSVATKTTVNRSELESTNAQNTYDAIKNVPGVVQADAKAGGGADNLQIRGIHLTSTTGYRFDGGVPIVNNVAMMTEDKAQVQVLKGAGALEYGIAAPAGIVNYVLKRATNRPINEVAFSGNGDGQAITTFDVGRRFGFRHEFGLRVITSGGATGGYARDTGGTRMLGTVTADWTTDRARVRLAYERFGVNIVENAGILQNKADKNGKITLPHFLDPTLLYSGDWDRQVGDGTNMQLQADVKLNDAQIASLVLGRSDAGRNRRIVTQIGSYNLVTGKGTETATYVRDQRYTNTYADLSTTYRVDHGNFSNVFTAGYTRNERLANNPQNQSATFKQNIYNPVTVPEPVFANGAIQYEPQNSRDVDYYFRDSMNFGRFLHLTGGLREINYTADDTVALNPTKVNHNFYSFMAPAIGAVVDVTRNASLYGSYVKSLEESPTAPINAKNAFAVLPPAPATQKEVGLRVRGARGNMSLAYFTISRANSTIDPVTNIFGLNGTNLFAGYESTLSYRLFPRLTLVAGGQYMDAKQHAPDDPTINGKIPENVPRVSGNVGLIYAPAFVRGLQVNGTLQAFGPRQINPQDQGTLPPVTLMNFGVSYTKPEGGKRVTFNLNCRNCMNVRYWSSAVNGALGIGPPRVVSFSLRFAGM